MKKLDNTEHRRRNYQICTGLDVTKIAVVLDQMFNDGAISDTKRKHYLGLTDGLRQVICDDNDFHLLNTKFDKA